MDGEISAETLQELLDSDTDLRIVDIRSPAQFGRGHIPGSDNIPFQELTTHIEQVADADRVVTVCPHGQASQQAARLIASFEGFDGRVDSLEPGIEGWPYDLETDEGSETEASDAPF
ncbi:rhodanese domain protein [Natronomonas pharaonis DSM 2160]|uniref:Rhodanese domain protein n=1 Tax=Natronomonas pharaonis (strain ATCC 35678 / DSM 2160 / CIP 103997 / JCM 8858 / NBRC 14720 / NCIMB 2260 / Gabara) TaxID=348780 RepID=A0A1U7ETP5_NATPD|nr:rhodanese-like domain-containing protein [Natronomonas pharaonis]CAI48286.1 rhodanese domain protein [Natronomonas pharaonis DSM 2160]